MVRLFIAVVALLALVPTDASAYSFAAAKGKDSGGSEVYEWCTRSTPSAAKDCALDKCEDSNGRGCKIVRDCNDGKWSGIAEAVHKDDARYHDSSCGWSKKTGSNSLKSKLAQRCEELRDKAPSKFKRCLASIIEPDQDYIANAYRWRWSNGDLVAY